MHVYVIFSWINGYVPEIANGPIVLCWPNFRGLAGIPAATERARVACCASARFVLSIAKQQRDPFSRGN